jgi:hypothetical protein
MVTTCYPLVQLADTLNQPHFILGLFIILTSFLSCHRFYGGILIIACCYGHSHNVGSVYEGWTAHLNKGFLVLFSGRFSCYSAFGAIRFASYWRYVVSRGRIIYIVDFKFMCVKLWTSVELWIRPRIIVQLWFCHGFVIFCVNLY